MPLDPSPMRAEFVSVYHSYAATPRESAHRQAKAYDAYARKAKAAASQPQFTGSETALLENTLYAAIMDFRSGTPERYAQAWANGVFAYWMSPVVKFSGGGILSGQVTAAPVVPVILPQLTALYRNLGSTAESCAARQAAILHTATLLVKALLIYPGSPPVTVVTSVT